MSRMPSWLRRSASTSVCKKWVVLDEVDLLAVLDLGHQLPSQLGDLLLRPVGPVTVQLLSVFRRQIRIAARLARRLHPVDGADPGEDGAGRADAHGSAAPLQHRVLRHAPPDRQRQGQWQVTAQRRVRGVRPAVVDRAPGRGIPRVHPACGAARAPRRGHREDRRDHRRGARAADRRPVPASRHRSTFGLTIAGELDESAGGDAAEEMWGVLLHGFTSTRDK